MPHGAPWASGAGRFATLGQSLPQPHSAFRTPTSALGRFVAQGVKAGGGQRPLLAFPILLLLVPLFLNLPEFWFPPVCFSFQFFSIPAFGFLLGFSIPYSTRGQSSNVRWVWHGKTGEGTVRLKMRARCSLARAGFCATLDG